jgi:uncharacterized membrane protein HdeD (DUF308 family)
MSNTHQDRYITKLLLGFAFITGGILLIFYTTFERARQDDWYLWGIIASVSINLGLYFLMSAIVHKVKSDLIKRQKMRNQQKTYPGEKETF